MIKNLMASQIVDVAAKVRALPQSLLVGDFFSGTGSFSLIMKAIVNAIESVVPKIADFPESLSASVIEICSIFD